MRILLGLLLAFELLNCLGQAAIIADPDGYTNVREQPNSKSKILYQVKNFEVFLISEQEGEWVEVFIPRNKFSIYDTPEQYIRGFMHQSRIRQLENLKIYTGTNFKFSYTIKTFNPEEHIIQWEDDKYVTFIDGQYVWGTDGDFPKNEIAKIEIELDGRKIPISPTLYSNLFECDNNFKIYELDSVFFIEQWNSDGAGGYLLVWTVNENGVVQRVLMKP